MEQHGAVCIAWRMRSRARGALRVAAVIVLLRTYALLAAGLSFASLQKGARTDGVGLAWKPRENTSHVNGSLL